MKVLMILMDGMRPDAITDIQLAQEIIAASASTMTAKTVMPSVTLPCHMSLFHSVEPSRHGTTTNTFAPQVRPVTGLCEALTRQGKKCAFFYDWEELRDLTRPGSLDHAFFCSGAKNSYADADHRITDDAIDYFTEHEIDFAFLYLGNPDEIGHRFGWMSEEYMKAVRSAWNEIDRILNALPSGYNVIILADHGGHDRIHGTDCPEDMTIPLIIRGEGFTAGSTLEHASILDIAPTVANLLNIAPDHEWEGKSLL
ncbi:MAG: alkaline phosphatase family protein [Oscillospiraceae bacterium]|nr:alkaline phosphatase family protein [Oscillospiraceae bacterium]